MADSRIRNELHHQSFPLPTTRNAADTTIAQRSWQCYHQNGVAVAVTTAADGFTRRPRNKVDFVGLSWMKKRNG